MNFYSNDAPDSCEEAKRELTALEALPEEEKREGAKKRIEILKMWIQENCSQ